MSLTGVTQNALNLLTVLFGQQLAVFEPLQPDALLALFGEGAGVAVP